MKTSTSLRLAAACLALALAGCETYSTFSERQPSYHSDTPAGVMIVHAMRHPLKSPEAQMGCYIDAASTAAAILDKNPADKDALKDYNFAVARLFETLHESGLEPWKAPVKCPAASGEWTFSVVGDGKPEHDPSHYRIVPADRFQFKGKLITDRTVKEGLGATVIISSKDFDPTKFDPFIQGKNVYYGVTETLHFKGRNCIAYYLDPLATEDVKFGNHMYPVAADFTAPIALALAELKPRKKEIERFFSPADFANSSRLARMQPYDPKKIPLLVIHGLGDSQATWAPMIEALRGDPVIRQNYQTWFYSYPTGYPYPLMAAILREKMDAIDAAYPGHKPIVVVGHSMGGMIARELMTDSGLTIWNSFFPTPPEKTPLSPEAKALVTKTLIFKHRTDISRVIYMSASLRGAYLATGFLGNLGENIIGSPPDLSKVGKEMAMLMKPRPADGKKLKRAPNSIDALDPNNRFVTTIDTIPLVKGIPYHSVIADRGKGGNKDKTPPQSSDGIVPYWSSHLDGAQSEVIVPSDHWSNRSPQGIAEVRRILYQHIGKTGSSTAPKAALIPKTASAQ
ncbi:MAG TPA: alpha/beta hydrolase [Chthoniobacter sp.]|nr:alpha/beta hydrolase [Chthoniobacter sp.]